MTTSELTIPTPPPWLNIDAVIPPGLRRQVFGTIATLLAAAGDTLTVSQLEQARTLTRNVDLLETPAYDAVDTASCEDEQSTANGALAILSNYTGSLALFNALSDYVERCISIDRYRYHPEEFMRPAEVQADT